MKTVKNYLGMLMLVILMGGVAADLQAQGRGNGKGNGNPGRGHDKENHPGKGHGKNRDKDHDHFDRDHKYSRHNDFRSERSHHGRYVKYSHHRFGRPVWAPVYGRQYNTRYIYYRDYNVYYDCQRDVFLTWTGRNWSISTRIPNAIYQVDFSRAVVLGVDYWDDDFNFYLARRRPAYVSIQANW
jgi:hypothetical protein